MTPTKLEEIRKRCEAGVPGYAELDVALKDCRALIAEVDRLREALAWYADGKNWLLSGSDSFGGEVWVSRDGGELARGVLNMLEVNKT